MVESAEGSVQSTTRRELVARRWLRRAALIGAACLALWLVVRPKNLALGKSVAASSVCAWTPQAPLGRERLYRVVDGVETEQSFALCTNDEKDPWLTVDLASSRRVDRVVVYPRADCCYGQLELPLSLQLSDDNQHFETVETTNTPAIPESPWRFSVSGRRARYVRLISHDQTARHIVISEFEIFGR